MGKTVDQAAAKDRFQRFLDMLADPRSSKANLHTYWVVPDNALITFCQAQTKGAQLESKLGEVIDLLQLPQYNKKAILNELKSQNFKILHDALGLSFAEKPAQPQKSAKSKREESLRSVKKTGDNTGKADKRKKAVAAAVKQRAADSEPHQEVTTTVDLEQQQALARIEELELTVRVLQAGLAEKSREANEKGTALVEAQQEMQGLQHELAAKIQAHAQAKQAFKEAVAQNANDLSAMHREAEGLEADLIAAELSREAGWQSVAQLQETLTNLQAQYDAQTQELHGARNESSALQAQILRTEIPQPPPAVTPSEMIILTKEQAQQLFDSIRDFTHYVKNDDDKNAITLWRSSHYLRRAFCNASFSAPQLNFFNVKKKLLLEVIESLLPDDKPAKHDFLLIFAHLLEGNIAVYNYFLGSLQMQGKDGLATTIITTYRLADNPEIIARLFKALLSLPGNDKIVLDITIRIRNSGPFKQHVQALLENGKFPEQATFIRNILWPPAQAQVTAPALTSSPVEVLPPLAIEDGGVHYIYGRDTLGATPAVPEGPQEDVGRYLSLTQQS